MGTGCGVETGLWVQVGVLACCSPVLGGEQMVGAAGNEPPPPPNSAPFPRLPCPLLLVKVCQGAFLPPFPTLLPLGQEGGKNMEAGVTILHFGCSLCRWLCDHWQVT